MGGGRAQRFSHRFGVAHPAGLDKPQAATRTHYGAGRRDHAENYADPALELFTDLLQTGSETTGYRGHTSKGIFGA